MEAASIDTSGVGCEFETAATGNRAVDQKREEGGANPVLTADRIDIGGRLTNSIIGEGNNGRENSVGGKINFTIKITADARGSCTR